VAVATENSVPRHTFQDADFHRRSSSLGNLGRMQFDRVTDPIGSTPMTANEHTGTAPPTSGSLLTLDTQAIDCSPYGSFPTARVFSNTPISLEEGSTIGQSFLTGGRSSLEPWFYNPLFPGASSSTWQLGLTADYPTSFEGSSDRSLSSDHGPINTHSGMSFFPLLVSLTLTYLHFVRLG
jgi:hypothetical protein